MNTEKLREEFYEEMRKWIIIKTEFNFGDAINLEHAFNFFLPYLETKPVEVSDEEIEKRASTFNETHKMAFQLGAHWMRDKQGIAPCKAVEFAQYCRDNYTTDTSGNKWYKQASGGMLFTTKELFNQFIKEEIK